MKRPVVIIAAVLVAVAIVLAAVTLGSRDQADEVDTGAASKRAEQRAGTTAARDQDPGLRPTPGTYTYVGSGSEHVDTLGGSTHDFPKRIPAVVTLGKGCEWTLDVFYVEQHQERRTYC